MAFSGVPSDADGRDSRGLRGPPARLRVCAALLAWCLGSLVSWHLPDIDAWRWIIAAIASLAIAAAFARVSTRPLGSRAVAFSLLSAAFLASVAWTNVRLHRLAADNLRVLVPEQSLLTLRGQVIETPRLTPPPRGELARFRFASADQSLRLDVRSVVVAGDANANDQQIRARGTVRVIVDGPDALGIVAGDVVELRGLFRPTRPRTTSQGPPFAPDAVGTLSLRDRGAIRAVEHSGWSRVRGAWLAARAAMQHRCAAALAAALPRTGAMEDEESRALMLDLVLGQGTPSNQPGGEVAPTLTRLGLAHALSISGFHLSVMAWLALQTLRLTGERGRAESLLVAALVLLYMFVVPTSSPVVRAGVLTIAVLMGEGLGRRYDRVTLLAWAAWLILLVRPVELWSIGFQLTFALTAALVWIGAAAHDRVFGERLFKPRPGTPRSMSRRVRDTTREAISTAVLCWGVGSPIVMAGVGVLNPWAMLASVLVGVPLTIALVAGYITLALGLVLPTLAAWFGPLLRLAAGGTMRLAHAIDALPGTVIRVPPTPIAWAACASLAIAWWFSRGRRRSRGVFAVLAVGLGGWLVGAWTINAVAQHRIDLRFDALSVRDGSAVLVRSRGEALLFNVGGVSDVGLRRVPDACRDLGAWHVPTIIVSGSSQAVSLGAPDAATMLGTRHVVVPQWAKERAAREPSQLWGSLVRGIEEAGATTHALATGDTISIGGVTLRVLTPGGTSDSANDAVAATTPRTPMSLVLEAAARNAGQPPRRVLLVGRPSDDEADAIITAAEREAALAPFNLLVSGASDTITTRLAKRLGVVRVLRTHDLEQSTMWGDDSEN